MLPPDLQDALTEASFDLPEFGRSLLLVDDEPQNLEVLTALLEGTCEVHAESNGPDALAWIAGGNPVDLVIADQRMPGMTGVELLTQVAQRCPDAVRVVLTAYSDVEPMLDAIDRGRVHRFLVKPYEPEELRATVSEGLQTRHSTALLRHLIEALHQRRAALNQTLEDLRQTHEQLIVAERMTTIGQATAGIVHDLRNLSTIMGLLMHEIRRKTADPEVVRSAWQALEGLEDLLTLLERLREFARAGDGELNLVPIEISRFLARAVSLAEVEHDRDRHPVQLADESASLVLPLDLVRMEQAVLALIDNAVRASPDGSPITIRVRRSRPALANADGASQSAECARVEIVDRGCGMDETTQARALEPLWSGFVPPRLGLGLEAARLAVTAHGGRLELQSGPGVGTTVSLVIPLGGVS